MVCVACANRLAAPSVNIATVVIAFVVIMVLLVKRWDQGGWLFGHLREEEVFRASVPVPSS